MRGCTLASNMKPDRFLLLFLAPQMALVSTAIAGRTQPSDDAIIDQVRMNITVHVPDCGGLVVAVKDGVVTLTGRLQTKGQKAQAEKLAKKVHGVKAVVNNITVANP